jgi:hypothetical protein
MIKYFNFKMKIFGYTFLKYSNFDADAYNLIIQKYENLEWKTCIQDIYR